MPRVLLLSDVDADFETARGVEGLAGGLGQGFDVSIWRGGIDQCHGLVRGVVGLRRSDVADGRLVHAWDPRALAAAVVGTRGRIVYSPPAGAMTSRHARWLCAVLAYRDVHVVCATATARRALVERGVPLERCHLIRPGVEFARIRPRRDPALRAALGFADADRVLLAPGESTRGAGHDLAVWVASILHVLDSRYRLLLWGRGPQADAAARLGSRQTHNPVACAAERLGRMPEPETLFPAADAILITATAPIPTLQVATAMASALPIVATVTPTVSELLEDRHTALMAPANAPRAIVRRVLDLFDDARLQWSVTDMARTEAYEYFSHSGFLSRYRSLYRQIEAGTESIELPEAEPGIAQRFHGRG